MGLSAISEEWCRQSDYVIMGNSHARKIVDNIICFGATIKELKLHMEMILIRCKEIGKKEINQNHAFH
jgi:hypothetical protein